MHSALGLQVCAYQDEQQQPQQPQPQPNSQGQLQQVDFRDLQLLRKDVELYSKDVEHKLVERIASLEVAQAASTAAVKQEVAAVKQEVIERSAALDLKLVQLKWLVICVVVLAVVAGATKLLPLVKLL